VTATVLLLEAPQRRGQLQGVLRRAVSAYRLPLMDEIGYVPMARDQTNLFFQVVARRYGEGATILTSNLSFGNWDQSFASEATVAGVEAAPRAAPRLRRTDQRRELSANRLRKFGCSERL
jgi:DNA replication protein DnaC